VIVDIVVVDAGEEEQAPIAGVGEQMLRRRQISLRHQFAKRAQYSLRAVAPKSGGVHSRIQMGRPDDRPKA